MSGRETAKQGCASVAVVLVGAPLVLIAGAFAGLAGFSCSGGVLGEGCGGGSWLPAVIIWVFGGLLVLWIASEVGKPMLPTGPVSAADRPVGVTALVCKACGAQNFQDRSCWRCGRNLKAG